jgi:phosphoglycolate phosphatase
VKDVGGTVPTDRQASFVIGMDIVQALAHAAPDVPREKHRELAARYRHHLLDYQHRLSLFGGVLQMLAELKSRRHLLAVATGMGRRGLDAALDTEEMRGIFDASRTADETAGKPDPRMLHELMEQLAVPAARVLMVGDTTHDLKMALNAGCASVAVSYGAHPPDSFHMLGPLFVAHTVAELRQWLSANA